MAEQLGNERPKISLIRWAVVDFLQNISEFFQQAINNIGYGSIDNAPESDVEGFE